MHVYTVNTKYKTVIDILLSVNNSSYCKNSQGGRGNWAVYYTSFIITFAYLLA